MWRDRCSAVLNTSNLIKGTEIPGINRSWKISDMTPGWDAALNFHFHTNWNSYRLKLTVLIEFIYPSLFSQSVMNYIVLMHIAIISPILPSNCTTVMRVNCENKMQKLITHTWKYTAAIQQKLPSLGRAIHYNFILYPDLNLH